MGETGIYTVKVVARLTGLPPDTLRAWERRYGAITPVRRDTGHRLYSEAEVVRLKLLREATEQGHPIGRVAPLDDGQLRALLARAPEARAESTIVEEVLDAALRFDHGASERILARAAALSPPDRLVHDVIAPLLQEVGRRWVAGTFGVAPEHLITAQVRAVLGTMVRLAPVQPGRPLLLLATPPGEIHELGLLMMAVLATGRGLPVAYLGPDVPVPDIATAARRLRPAVVGVSLACAPDPGAALADVAALVQAVAPAEVWVGGGGAMALPEASWPTGARRFGTLAAAEVALLGLANG